MERYFKNELQSKQSYSCTGQTRVLGEDSCRLCSGLDLMIDHKQNSRDNRWYITKTRKINMTKIYLGAVITDCRLQRRGTEIKIKNVLK